MDNFKDTSILIVEDDGIIAEDISSLLKVSGFSVAGVAHDGASALDLLASRNPNFAILDIHIGSGMSGLDIAQVIHNKYKIPYIFLTSFDDDATLDAAQEQSPYGYLVKPFQERTLLTTIKTALKNYEKSQGSEQLTKENVDAKSVEKTTEQEFKIISELLLGKSYKQISAENFISINTVKYHVKNIYTKLEIKRRAELVTKLL